MRLVYRLLIAIPMALVGLFASFQLYFLAYMLGGLATDSCSGALGGFWYLSYVWPFAMAAAVLIPPLLVVANARWPKVLLALVAAPLVTGACYLAWFPILMITCQ